MISVLLLLAVALGSIPSGDASVSIATIGTAASAIAAAVALRTLQEDRGARRSEELKDKEREVRSQASKVAAWIEPNPMKGRKPVVIVQNSSNLPIYSVLVGPFLADDSQVDQELKLWGSVNPGRASIPTQSLQGNYPRNLILEFRDTNGALWRRNSDGSLDRIEELSKHWFIPEALHTD